MKKLLFLVLLSAIVITGIAFAEDEVRMPINAITVDIGPTIIGGAFASLDSFLADPDEDSSGSAGTSGFGIALQYERQLTDKLSVAGRFAYLGVGVNFTDSLDTSTVRMGMDITSFSLEGHVRFYPGGNIFFFDGMLGYANTSFGFDITAKESITNTEESISVDVSRGHIKMGAKIGWRIDFGKPGGFIMETSFGWNFNIGLGDGLGTRFANEVYRKTQSTNDPTLQQDMRDSAKDMDESLAMLEQFFFVGGPRLTIAFGWRF